MTAEKGDTVAWQEERFTLESDPVFEWVDQGVWDSMAFGQSYTMRVTAPARSVADGNLWTLVWCINLKKGSEGDNIEDFDWSQLAGSLPGSYTRH